MGVKTANIDYICIIRERNGKISFETIDIPVPTDLLSRLEGLLEDDNATVLDMQAQMNLNYSEGQRGPINYISPYSYASSYIEYTYYPVALTFSDYNDKIAGKRDLLRKDFSVRFQNLQEENPSKYLEDLNHYLEREMAHFIKDLKREYLRSAKRFISASNYMQTLHEAEGQGNVRMFSTDTLGWSSFTYPVTKEITISLGTNFGYGSASYFRLGLSYKGVDVLPYSYMVKYYYANRRDLIRYTRLYDVAHDSWNLAFNFVEEVANMAVVSTEEFVRQWILNEIKDMVCRLHDILVKPDEYIHEMLNRSGEKADCDYFTVRNMDNNERRRYGVCPEEMTMAIRAEKISGSLDFLDNLSKLSTILSEIGEYIEEIKDMAFAIIPEINEMVSTITNRVAYQQEEKAHIEVNLTEIKKKLAPHNKAIDALYEVRGEGNKWRSRSYYEMSYAEIHQDYAKLKEEESKLCSHIAKLSDEIFLRTSFREHLLECRRRVSDASLIDNNNTAQH